MPVTLYHSIREKVWPPGVSWQATNLLQSPRSTADHHGLEMVCLNEKAPGQVMPHLRLAAAITIAIWIGLPLLFSAQYYPRTSVAFELSSRQDLKADQLLHPAEYSLTRDRNILFRHVAEMLSQSWQIDMAFSLPATNTGIYSISSPAPYSPTSFIPRLILRLSYILQSAVRCYTRSILSLP